MDIIVLGLLILHGGCTIYELRKFIETRLTSISSNSMGSIQTAIKKLLEKKMIVYNEFVENSVNKKNYLITDVGKSYFFQMVQTPMAYKEKNMELCKFFFMGFAPREKQGELLTAYLTELYKEKAQLKKIQTEIPAEDDALNGFVSSNDIPNFFPDTAEQKITIENLKDIVSFQYAMLNLSISKIEFEIEWFENYRKRLEEAYQ